MSDEQTAAAEPEQDPEVTSAGEDDNPETSATGEAVEGFNEAAVTAGEPHGEYAASEDQAAEPEPADAADTAEYSGGGQPEEPVASDGE